MWTRPDYPLAPPVAMVLGPDLKRLVPSAQEQLRHLLERWSGALRARFKPKARLAGGFGRTRRA